MAMILILCLCFPHCMQLNVFVLIIFANKFNLIIKTMGKRKAHINEHNLQPWE